MVVITFILVYILIGIVVASIFAWDEIRDTFTRSEPDSQNKLTKGEWREFWFLIMIYVFGWGIGFAMIVIESVKGLWRK